MLCGSQRDVFESMNPCLGDRNSEKQCPIPPLHAHIMSTYTVKSLGIPDVKGKAGGA